MQATGYNTGASGQGGTPGPTGQSASGSPPAAASPESSSTNQLQWFKENFRPHFDNWVTDLIDRLISSGMPLAAFIVMYCAIDWLAGFYWGKTTQGESGQAYKTFVKNYFQPENRYDPQGLYDSLRNGLVHMFTIKNKKYALTHNEPGRHLQVGLGGQIILNCEDFRTDLVAAKNLFFDSVESDPALLAKVRERYDRDGFLEIVQV